jgi:hypothetical protein
MPVRSSARFVQARRMRPAAALRSFDGIEGDNRHSVK